MITIIGNYHQIGKSIVYHIIFLTLTIPAVQSLYTNFGTYFIFLVPTVAKKFIGKVSHIFFRGPDGVGHRASDFHFNAPGFKSRFGHENFSSRFRVFLQVCTIRTLDRWKHFDWLAKFQAFIMRCLYVSVNVIIWKECKYVDEALWPEHGGLGYGVFPLFPID